MRPPTHPIALGLLTLPAAIYGGAVRLRNRWYEKAGTTLAAPIPVISVGNLTVGGTGKTPFVAWLARHLAEAGYAPAVVSRGYGGTAGRGPCLVSRGDGPQVAATVCGDEPFLLASSLPGTIVVVGSDRHRGAVAAASAGANVVLLDDGFQHRRLARDLDIVLLDASNPFGNYRLLPAGLLREPVRGLSRADIVVVTRAIEKERFTVIERVIRHHRPDAPIFYASHRILGFFDRAGREHARPRRALAFCGIGNPSRFRMDLEAAGLEIVQLAAFPDHHPFRRSELAALFDAARRRELPLITTEKDLVRITALSEEDLDGVTLLTSRIEAFLPEGDELLRSISERLGERPDV